MFIALPAPTRLGNIHNIHNTHPAEKTNPNMRKMG
jgi:hypothetical protein